MHSLFYTWKVLRGDSHLVNYINKENENKIYIHGKCQLQFIYVTVLPSLPSGVCPNLWDFTNRLLWRIQDNGIGRPGCSGCTATTQGQTSVLGPFEGRFLQLSFLMQLQHLSLIMMLPLLKMNSSHFRTAPIVWKTSVSGEQSLNLETSTVVPQIQTWTLTTGHFKHNHIKALLTCLC